MRTYYEYYKKLDTLNSVYKTDYKDNKINITVLLLISLFSLILFSINIFVAAIVFLSLSVATVFVGVEYYKIKKLYLFNKKVLNNFILKYNSYIQDEILYGRKRYYETESEREERTRREFREKRERMRNEARERARERNYGGSYYDDYFGDYRNTYFDEKDIHDIFEEFFKKQQQNSYYNNSGYDYYKRNRQNNRNNSRLSNDKTENAYTLLKLSRNDSITIIKKKYRELAIKWHPDKWVNDKKENQQIAERNFKKLNNAYALIKKDKGFS